MDKILKEANDIGDFEHKTISNTTDLNCIYAKAESLMTTGYKMYNANLILETFIIFMRVTKLYEIICNNKHLISSNRRHYQLKHYVTKIITILEFINHH
jgi:hypothetical protein